MKDFKIVKDREYIMKRMGDISQLAGVKRYEISEGKAKGVEAVDFKTGAGLNFTVLPGRGMDIAWADYKGIPLSYISKTGIVSPAYYESDGMNWLRNFFGGLLTTCGLSNVGTPCEEMDDVVGKKHYGLHGRIANIAAENVCVCDEWQGNDFVMSVEGRLRESVLHGENLTLKRKITTRLGETCLVINDIVTNEGFCENPVMILYHINLGYPVLDDGSRFICSSNSIIAASENAKTNIDNYNVMQSPFFGIKENVFFHNLNTQDDSNTYVGLINDKLEVGIYVKFNKNQLQRFTQWKMLSEAEYVLGLEPANCYPVGREEQTMRGELEYLKPGEKKEIQIEIGVLTNQQQISDFEYKVNSLRIGG